MSILMLIFVNMSHRDTKQLAQAINNMFVSIGKDLQPLLFMIYPTVSSFLVTLMYQWRMWRNIWCTHLHKAIGPDQLTNWILSDMAGIIAAPICDLFNSSLRDSYIPTYGKVQISAQYQRPNQFKISIKAFGPSNYVGTMLEQYPVNRIWETFQNVDCSQFAAVKGSSITFALLEILHPIYKATDDHQNYIRILLIDFSKAFDHIDQNILLNKLNINGVHPTIQRWYHNVLQGRQQRVKMIESFSEWNTVNGWVPQGISTQ